MLSQIRRGDKIVTTGGLTGIIIKVTDESQTVIDIQPPPHLDEKERIPRNQTTPR